MTMYCLALSCQMLHLQEKDNDYAPPPYGAEVSTLRHIVVYDSNTVSVVENSESPVAPH